MSPIRFSIVTPVYNDPRLIRAVGSVLAQTGPFECESIVVDGMSDDPPTLDAEERCRTFGARVVREKDDGIYDAMNKGIALARGEIVGMLNADDEYVGSSVLAMVDRAMQDDAVDVCYGDLVYVDPRGRPVRVWRAGTASRLRWHFGWMPPHPTFFVRRRVYETYGSFDLAYSTAADYELMFRLMMEHRLRAAYIPHELVRMATGGASANIATVVHSNRLIHHIWRRYSLPASLWIPVLKPASKGGQYVAAALRRVSTSLQRRAGIT